MKHIYLNLKRFDVPAASGGVNRLAPIEQWGSYIVAETQRTLAQYDVADVEFVHYFPEAHLISAFEARSAQSALQIGCQGVYRANTAVGGNFGAFTTNRPASSMRALGCRHTIIGHCEERNDKRGILAEANTVDADAINRLLNQEICQAVSEGMDVLYCIGETAEEQPQWQEVLRKQLEIGLEGIDKRRIVVGYEPVWSIGPGKTPADKAYITKVARFIKELTGGIDVVYGGGLKEDNAQMLAGIPEIDGGLIALTRFQGDIGFYPEEYARITALYLAQ